MRAGIGQGWKGEKRSFESGPWCWAVSEWEVARINIETCWWTDPRRSALIRLVGDEDKADGVAVRAWALAQEFWKRGRGLVPKHLFDVLSGSEHLVSAGLADVRESFVYVRGSSAYLDWVAEKREQAKAAGKKSAEARRAKNGNAQPKRRTKPERTPNEPRTESNDAEPSVSGSGSLSGSGYKDSPSGNELALAPPEELPLPKKSQFDDATRAKMRAFMATYASAYRERYGGPPEKLRDPAILGKIGAWIQTVSEERACQLAQVYLQIDHRRINDEAHDPWLFFRYLNLIGNALSSGQDPGGIDWTKVFGAA